MRDKFVFDFERKMPHPPQVKVQRARVVILDGKRLVLKKCEGCQVEFYETELILRCEKCRTKKRKRA
jgi:hypothetical protein